MTDNQNETANTQNELHEVAAADSVSPNAGPPTEGAPTANPDQSSSQEGVSGQAQGTTAKAAPKGQSNAGPGAKKSGNKNALLHGVYSNEIVLPWESVSDFEKLHEAYKDEWKPNGCSEEQAVLDLAWWTWIKWRSTKMAQLQFQKVKPPSGMNSWEDILAQQYKVPSIVEDLLNRASTLLQTLQKQLDGIDRCSSDIDTPEGKQLQWDIAELGKKLSVFMDQTSDRVMPLIGELAKAATLNATSFDLAFQPNTIEKQVQIMAAIDSRIEKVLRRLTALKEYKRIAGVQTTPPHLLESPPVVPNKNATEKAISALGDMKADLAIGSGQKKAR